MEGLLAYEDTATIIASIYVEQEQSEKNFKKLLGINPREIKHVSLYLSMLYHLVEQEE
jgi:hypothetical protein